MTRIFGSLLPSRYPPFNLRHLEDRSCAQVFLLPRSRSKRGLETYPFIIRTDIKQFFSFLFQLFPISSREEKVLEDARVTTMWTYSISVLMSG